MATLKEPVKIFIVQSLACFETPQQVVDAVREEFGIEIERQQVASYDPIKATCRGMSKKLKTLFEHTREHFKKNIYDIPLANKAVRLNAVNALILNAEGERTLKVNTNKCPRFTETLEQQIYDDFGMPDKKSGLDHVGDAGGYPLAKRFPIIKPVTSLKDISIFGRRK